MVENRRSAKLRSRAIRKLKDDELKKDLQAKIGRPLWRPLVQSDVGRIIELYRQRGYFQVRVEPKTIEPATTPRRSGVRDQGGREARRGASCSPATTPSPKQTDAAWSRRATDQPVELLCSTTISTMPTRSRTTAICLRRFYRAHGYHDVRCLPMPSYEADKYGVAVDLYDRRGSAISFRQGRLELRLKTVEPPSSSTRCCTPNSGDAYDAARSRRGSRQSPRRSPRAANLLPICPRESSANPSRLINLVYAIEKGKRLYVERINIHGNKDQRQR